MWRGSRARSTAPGARAAAIIGAALIDAGGPPLSNADEEAARALFQGAGWGHGHWPYVWRAAATARPTPGRSAPPSSTPTAGPSTRSSLRAGRGARRSAGTCSASAPGHRAPRRGPRGGRPHRLARDRTHHLLGRRQPGGGAEVFSRSGGGQGVPMVPFLLRVAQWRAPRPQTQYYGEVSRASSGSSIRRKPCSPKHAGGRAVHRRRARKEELL